MAQSSIKVQTRFPTLCPKRFEDIHKINRIPQCEEGLRTKFADPLFSKSIVLWRYFFIP
jgi:hypothetical protein